jgi:hypothetical protein
VNVLGGKVRNKYNNKKTAIDGITFDSQLEARRYCELKLLKKAGQIKDFLIQPQFEIIPAYRIGNEKHSATHYRADFKVIYLDGHEEIEDCKGFKTPVYKLKKKMMEYRGYEIKEIY